MSFEPIWVFSGFITMDLTQVVESHSTPLNVLETHEDNRKKWDQIQRLLSGLLPCESAGRNHLLEEKIILVEKGLTLDLRDAFLNYGIQIMKLDMSFMKICTRSPSSTGSWLVPQFALVNVFDYWNPVASITYGLSVRTECHPSAAYAYGLLSPLYDVERLANDIPSMWGLWGRNKKRRIRFEWQGTMPSQIRALANTAKDLVGEGNVFLVLDTAGQWECKSYYQAAPADPLLVAKVGSSWFLLGRFDPSPLKEWAAAEMT